MSKYVNLDDILGKNAEELRSVREGEFETDKLGVVPFSALTYEEFSKIKKACMKMAPNGTGGMEPEMDEDALMIRVIIAAVDKDKRSDFTFAHKPLLEKLGAVKADDVVSALLQPGEVFNFAKEIQDASGFGAKAQKDARDTAKNS